MQFQLLKQDFVPLSVFGVSSQRFRRVDFSCAGVSKFDATCAGVASHMRCVRGVAPGVSLPFAWLGVSSQRLSVAGVF